MKIITYSPGYAVAQFVEELHISRQVMDSITNVVIWIFC
jgi:hypothetical protein